MKINHLAPALLALATAITVSAQQPACVPVPSDAAFWWRGQSSTADVLGGNPGALQGSADYSASGKVGQAFNFNHGVLRVYNRPALEAQNLSIEAWVFARSSGVFNDTVGPVVVSKDRGNFSPSISYSLAGPSNSGRFRASVGLTDGTDPAVFSTSAFPFSTFHHVAMTWDGYDIRLYVNGVLEGLNAVEQRSNPPKTVLYGGHDVGVGRHPLFGTRNFDGLIDEPTFYTRALSAAEIQSLHAAGSAGKCLPAPPTCATAPSGLVHWWRGENNGADSAGSSTGVLEGGAGYTAGAVNTAFNFNNGVVRVASDPGLESQTLSIEAWVYPRTIGTWNDEIGPVIVSKDRGYVSPSISYSLAGPSNNGRFRASVGLTDGTAPAVYSTHVFAFHAFHHLVMTWDGYDLRLFVNGALEGELAVQSRADQNPPATVIYGGHDVGIGRHPLYGTREFDGAIDEPSFYNRALSLNEVRSLFAAAPAGKCLDASPPAVSILSPADGAIVGDFTVAVSGLVADASGVVVTSTPAGIQATLPPGGGAFGGTLPLLVEGENTLAVHAVDEPQNPPGGQSITVIRDTVAPAVDVLSPIEGAVTAASSIAVVVAVVDATRVEVALGLETRTVEPGGAAATFTVALVEGVNTLSITATDAAGHVTPFVRTVVLDSTRPSVTIDSPPEGAVFGPGASPITVAATVVDFTATAVTSEPSGVSGLLPAGGGTVSGSTPLVEGYNAIRVTAVDATGISGTSERVVLLDTTAPAASLSSPGDGAVLRGLVDFDAEAADAAPGSGVAAVVLKIDGVVIATPAAAPFGVDLNTADLADGPHVFSATAVDGIGNSSVPASVSVLVDNTPPCATFFGLANGAIVSGSLAFQLQLS